MWGKKSVNSVNNFAYKGIEFSHRTVLIKQRHQIKFIWWYFMIYFFYKEISYLKKIENFHSLETREGDS
jgi:hypothetical protein